MTSSSPLIWIVAGLILFPLAGLAVEISNAALFIAPEALFLQTGPLIFALLCMAWMPNAVLTKSSSLPKSQAYNSAFFFGLSLLLLAFLILVNRHVLQRFMNSADEHSCYFLAQCLIKGKLWASPHPLHEFFETPHIGVLNGKWFSVYPPAWPAIWALGIKLGLKDWINPMLAACGAFIFLTFGRKIFGGPVAALAGIFLFISPFFLLTGGAYYSHNLCLLLLGIFFYASHAWLEEGKRAGAVWAGLALGLGLATRYLTLAAMAVPVLGYGLYIFAKRKSKWEYEGWIFTIITVTLIAAHSTYNFLITGDFFDFPNHYLHPHEKLGFIAGYTPLTAMGYFLKRILYAVDWTPPFVVVLCLISFFSKASGPWDKISRWSVAFLAFGYTLYYSWGGNQYGPRYYFEAYPLVCLLAAARIHHWSEAPSNALKKTAWGIAVGILIFSLPILTRHFRDFQQISVERRSTYDKIRTETQKPALVFLNGFLGDKLVLSPEDSVRNSPFFDRDVVLARDRGEKNAALAQAFPEHNVYRASYDRVHKKPVLEKGI